MNELLRGVFYAITGIATNQLEYPTRLIFDHNKPPYTLTKLVQYVEGGVMIILLFGYAVLMDKRISKETKGIVFVHLVLCFFWSGGGVVLANIYNAVTGRDWAGRE